MSINFLKLFFTKSTLLRSLQINEGIKIKINSLYLEFGAIDNKKNGFLYKNNDLNDFLKKFDEFKNTDIDKLKVKKINLKKEIKKFTMYSHYNALNQIIFKQ